MSKLYKLKELQTHTGHICSDIKYPGGLSGWERKPRGIRKNRSSVW